MGKILYWTPRVISILFKAKQLRRSGFIPGSVFGGSLPECISLQIDEKVARKLIREKREGSKLNLNLDEKLISVQIKEKEINTLNSEILHISFQALKADQKVNSLIHIILRNMEKVTDSLETRLLEIPYAAFPEDMIDTITIDLDGMEAGKVITVSDIPELVSDKIELQVNKEEVILQIIDKKRATKRGADQ